MTWQMLKTPLYGIILDDKYSITSMNNSNKNKTKIYICYADAGGGHKSVANALKGNIMANYSGLADIELANIANDYGDFFLKNIGKFYGMCIKRFPLIWEFGFVKLYTRHPRIGDIFLRIAWTRYGKFIKEFIDNNPADAYISTIHIYGYFLSKYREVTKKDFKIITVVTDISYLGFFWVNKHHDLIILPTEECKTNGKKLIEKYNVGSVTRILGLPIDERYYSNTFTHNNKKSNSGLKILIATGGEGSNAIWDLCKKLNELNDQSISIEVSVGRNAKLAEKINSFKWKTNITAFGWIPSLIEKYQTIDLVITKAGPTTIWECMAMDKPMIIYSYIKGQEDGNKEFAMKRSRAIYEEDFDKIAALIKNIAKLGTEKSFPYPPSYSKEFAATNWTAKVCKEIIDFILNSQE